MGSARRSTPASASATTSKRGRSTVAQVRSRNYARSGERTCVTVDRPHHPHPESRTRRRSRVRHRSSRSRGATQRGRRGLAGLRERRSGSLVVAQRDRNRVRLRPRLIARSRRSKSSFARVARSIAGDGDARRAADTLARDLGMFAGEDSGRRDVIDQRPQARELIGPGGCAGSLDHQARRRAHHGCWTIR